MLLRSCVLKSFCYLPYLIAQRSKVRILPKEHYDDYETPFMKSRALPGRSFITEVFIMLHRKNITLSHIKNWMKWRKLDAMRKDQKYISLRHETLGPDLATTHFITIRGGKVKFKGSDQWITYEDIQNGKIPATYTPGFFIETLDASGTDLCYEGIENFCNLRELKNLILKNCPHLDDWCLKRFHFFEQTLQHLDISGCQNVTERGICTLHILKRLKTLVIEDISGFKHKELVCLLLQEILPSCEIVGVNYENNTLKKRIGNYMN